MVHSIIILVLFLIGAVYEVCEIIYFERHIKVQKDGEYTHLYRKCHYTYLAIFLAVSIDKIIALLS
ncbi:MAG: hypothetical protein KBT00_04170 [Bacteroidales bacterium]|nr:hypothetical protein [Candidatus Cacconaster merdequi]